MKIKKGSRRGYKFSPIKGKSFFVKTEEEAIEIIEEYKEIILQNKIAPKGAIL